MLEEANDSFEAIASDIETEATPTPEVEAGDTEVSPPSEEEVPNVLKDEPTQDEGDEEGPDLSLDPDLEKHPILKAKWESYKAQKDRGVSKYLNEQREKLKAEIEAEYQPPEHVQQYEQINQLLSDPEKWQDTIRHLERAAREYHGVQGEPIQSKYGLAHASDDLVLERAVERAKRELREEFKDVRERTEREKQVEAATQKATQAHPAIKAEYGEWVTPEMVKEAISAHPQLDPMIAFNAVHAKAIAKHFANYAQSRQKAPARELTRGLTSVDRPERTGDSYNFADAIADVELR